MHNLTEGRAGTTDAEREVTFTAGGVAAVRVKVTIRIGQQSGFDCFILTIRDVLEIRGAENIEQDPEPEQEREPEVVGMPNAPARSSWDGDASLAGRVKAYCSTTPIYGRFLYF